MSESARSRPICRRCRTPITLSVEFCPKCGAADPGGYKMAQVGSLVYGGLIAAAVTGLYAWIMSSDWERWERKIRGLPADHALADAPWETAVGIGFVVFVFTWVASGCLFSRFVRERALPRGCSRRGG